MMETSTPALVSIIMPAYNAAQYIAEAIGSVINQTYPYWELIVVDDGSTDNTKGIVKLYQQCDSRIKYIYQGNARQSRARNNGIMRSAGSYIAFLDSDDLWLPSKLEIQVKKLQDANVDLVFSESYVFQNKFSFSDSDKRVMNAGKGVFNDESGLKVFLQVNQIPMLTVLAKREAIARAGNFPENNLVQNAEDYYLWLKMLLVGCTLLGMPECLAAYRIHINSVSNNDRLYFREIIERKADLCKEFPNYCDIIRDSIRDNIRTILELASSNHGIQIFPIFSRYFQMTNQIHWRFIFAGWDKLGMRNLALRTMYFILNYL